MTPTTPPACRSRASRPTSRASPKETPEKFRCARCGASAAPRATHAAHVAEPRIASAGGPRHWRSAPHRSDRPCVSDLLAADALGLARAELALPDEAVQDRLLELVVVGIGRV